MIQPPGYETQGSLWECDDWRRLFDWNRHFVLDL